MTLHPGIFYTGLGLLVAALALFALADLASGPILKGGLALFGMFGAIAGSVMSLIGITGR